MVATGTFWNNDSPLQAEYRWIWDNHVPATGKCTNKVAEAVRVMSRIYYGLFNNGDFSTNNGRHHEGFECADTPTRDIIDDIEDRDARLLEDPETYDEQCRDMEKAMTDTVRWAYQILHP